MNYSQSNYSNGDDHRSIKRRRLQNQSSCPSFTNHQSYEPPQEAPAAPSFKAKDGSRMVWDQKAAKWVKEVEVKVEEPVNPAPSFTAKDGSRMVWDAKSAKWVKDISHQKSPTPTTFKSSYKPYGDRRHSQTDGGYQDHRYLASETFSAPASDVMYDPTQPANQTFTNETDHNHALYNPSSLSIDDLIRGLQNPTQHREPTESAKTHTPLQPSITAHPSPPVKAELPTPRDSQSPETTESTGIEQLFKDVDWSKASKKTLHDVFYHMDGEMFASYYDEDTTMKDDEPTTSTFQVKKKSNRTTYHPLARRDENIRYGYQLKSEHEAGDPTCRPVKKEGRRYLGLDDMCGMLGRPSTDTWDEFAMARQLKQVFDDNDVNVPPP